MIVRSLLLVGQVACAVRAQPIPGASQPDAVQRLAWMSGCWQRVSQGGNRVVDEQWMAPRSRMMLGMSRTVRGDSVVEYEHLAIFQRADRAVYRAWPSGQATAEFVSVALSDTLAVFENPAHDFPQRIVYRPRGVDSLVARIEGTVDGQTRGVDYPFSRASCMESR